MCNVIYPIKSKKLAAEKKKPSCNKLKDPEVYVAVLNVWAIIKGYHYIYAHIKSLLKL